MLPLLLVAIVFLFLFLGSLVFVACVLIPPTRKYALSAALWCALWGPCSVSLMALAGLGLVATAFLSQDRDVTRIHVPRLLAAFGWTYLIVGILITVAVATGSAWIHQKAVRRLTFTLFRLYATAVSAGIGSVFGWCFSWWLISALDLQFGFVWSSAAMVVLVATFGTVGYKIARQLRGEAPASFTWITPDEFAGIDPS